MPTSFLLTMMKNFSGLSVIGQIDRYFCVDLVILVYDHLFNYRCLVAVWNECQRWNRFRDYKVSFLADSY